uniref:acetamidase n=1 Tax=uncultured Rothia sp. TaxID=316088 RepID=UPI0025D89A4C|nr:acetamidase [uncultured Rothia sp.]
MSSSQVPESQHPEKSTGTRGRFAAVGDAAKRRGRNLVVPRRSLLLTGGVILAGGLIATAPRIAATGLLGEDAAATVSAEKLLARRERRVREKIDTRYLRIESLGRINVGKEKKEQNLRLVGSLALTEAAQADLPAAAEALAQLSVYGSIQRLSVTYGGVDPFNDPQGSGQRADTPVPPLRVNDSATLDREQWLKLLNASAALGTNADYTQGVALADELRLAAVIEEGEYADVARRFRALGHLGTSEDRVKQVRLYARIALSKAVRVPSGAETKIAVSVAEAARVAVAADALDKAVTPADLSLLTAFTLTWNARQEYPTDGRNDALSLGFKAPSSKDEPAREKLKEAMRRYLKEQSGPLSAVSKREASMPGEVIKGS